MLRKSRLARCASAAALGLAACAGQAPAPDPVSTRAAETPTLPPALSGERATFDGGAAGPLSYYVSGPDGVGTDTAATAAPLLLIHSINAAASASEVRPLYERYRAQRRVYALDLPGYGFSERSRRDYNPRLMTDALHAMVAEIQRREGGLPVDALAVSLSTEFLARAASETPAAFRSLALVSPTGFSGRKRRDGAPGSTREVPGLHALLSASLWDDGLFRLLTRPGVIRYFLERTWGGKNIDEELWRYDVLTTRQPGAKYAPLKFLSAAMFANDITPIYESLSMPVWMSHGVRGDFVDYRGQSVVEGRGNWRFDVFQTGALPYFEDKAAFIERYDGFFSDLKR